MRKRKTTLAAGAFLFGFVYFPFMVKAADSEPANIEFFEKKIRPVLVENCYKCHGNGNKKGQLQLDSRAGMLKGGEIGPVVIPGQPDQSVLIKAIRYTDDVLKMPPKGKLPETTIADFVQWVKSGAPWPETAVAKGEETGKRSLALNARKKPWSLMPLQNHLLPPASGHNWAFSPIDTFIQTKLEAAR